MFIYGNLSGDSRDLNLINQKEKSDILPLQPIYLFTIKNQRQTDKTEGRKGLFYLRFVV